jgi:hypothetical protein
MFLSSLFYVRGRRTVITGRVEQGTIETDIFSTSCMPFLQWVFMCHRTTSAPNSLLPTTKLLIFWHAFLQSFPISPYIICSNSMQQPRQKATLMSSRADNA